MAGHEANLRWWFFATSFRELRMARTDRRRRIDLFSLLSPRYRFDTKYSVISPYNDWPICATIFTAAITLFRYIHADVSSVYFSYIFWALCRKIYLAQPTIVCSFSFISFCQLITSIYCFYCRFRRLPVLDATIMTLNELRLSFITRELYIAVHQMRRSIWQTMRFKLMISYIFASSLSGRASTSFALPSDDFTGNF